MMHRLAALAVSCMIATGVAFAQTSTPERAQKSDQVMMKLHELDVLYFILPLTMSKQQWKEVLPALEKIRANVKKVQAAEAEELQKLEFDLDKSIKESYEKGLVATQELRNKIATMMKKFAMARQVGIAMNVDTMYELLIKVWNAGQRKVAAKSLNPKDYDPTVKVEEMSEEDKIRLFIREIMLNPAAYDVMVKLSR